MSALSGGPYRALLRSRGVAPLAAAFLLLGIGAPVTTAQLAVIDEVAPAGHRAEAFTWLGTLYGSGLALGAAVCGQLIVGGHAAELRAGGRG